MQIVRWIAGLINTIYIHFFVGLAIAMLMVKWTWLDMRSNAGAMVFALIIISVTIYVMNSKIKLYRTLYWQGKLTSLLMLLASGVIIIATNSFKIDHLKIVPAYTVRAGFFLRNISLDQINLFITLLIVVGTIVYVYYRQINDNQFALNRVELSKRTNKIIKTMMYIVFAIITLYLVQPGVRYFINQYVLH